ncbi:MAG: hypothetical protein ACOXZM_10555 [Eubacteriales bacterium]
MLLIKNGYVKPMCVPDIPNGCVLIDGGKIAGVGENLPVPDGCEVIDAGGRLVTPGFVEAHCHIGLEEEGIGFEGSDVNERTDPCTPQMRAIDAVNRHARHSLWHSKPASRPPAQAPAAPTSSVGHSLRSSCRDSASTI